MTGRTAARGSSLMSAISAVAVIVALASCGKPPVTRPVIAPAPDCEIVPAPPQIPDTITVVLFDRVALEFAPWGHNSSEQRLFRYLYETLITTDCLGNAHVALAESWRREAGGLQWVFELREGAKFWDGSRVTSGDVVRSWEDALMLDTGIDSAVVEGEKTVRVYVSHAHREVPHVLSAPAFGVAKRSGYWEWPIGSGPYRIVSAERAHLGSETSGIWRRTITAVPASDGRKPVIRFVEASPNDARDLLDGPIDLMITPDPTVIDYALGNPQLTAVPLPWEKSYVLLSKFRVEESLNGRPLAKIPPDLLDGLAAQAVRSDARGCRDRGWWDDLGDCEALVDAKANVQAGPRGGGPISVSRRVLYDVDDPTARDLAERIVALAAADPAVSGEARAIASALPGLVGGRLEILAEGVASGELDRSLRSGHDFAYIIALPRRPSLPCDETSRLLERAPWLAISGADLPKVLLPLVDTRAHAIIRKDRFGLTSDGYGDVRIFKSTSSGE